jgi:hypothetical protein
MSNGDALTNTSISQLDSMYWSCSNGRTREGQTESYEESGPDEHAEVVTSR